MGMTNYEARFGGIRRLFGTEGQERLRRAHVCVIGIGGVGSWAVEALARTAGRLTLVDSTTSASATSTPASRRDQRVRQAEGCGDGRRAPSIPIAPCTPNTSFTAGTADEILATNATRCSILTTPR
jgi:hypothetical protein